MSLTTVKYCVCLICLSLLLAMPSMAHTGFVYSANWVSSTIDVIDPATNKIVQTIKVDLPHGVNFSPDGSRIYVTSEDEEVRRSPAMGTSSRHAITCCYYSIQKATAG